MHNTRTRTRNPNFLVKPDPKSKSPTRQSLLVGVDPDLHPGVVLFHLGLLLVYKLLNSLNWLSRFLLGTIQSSFHLLLKKESAKALLMLNEEKVLMLWAIFSSLVFGLAWFSSLRFSLWNCLFSVQSPIYTKQHFFLMSPERSDPILRSFCVASGFLVSDWLTITFLASDWLSTAHDGLLLDRTF